VIVERLIPSGGWLIYGRGITRRYFGYTKREAIRRYIHAAKEAQ
jgi:hypothetical protein